MNKPSPPQASQPTALAIRPARPEGVGPAEAATTEAGLPAGTFLKENQVDKEAMGRLILEASTGMHGDVAKQLSDAWVEMANEVNRLEEKKQTLADLAEANNRSKLEQITRLQARMNELKDELTHQLAWEHKAGNLDNQSHRYKKMHAVLHKE